MVSSTCDLSPYHALFLKRIWEPSISAIIVSIFAVSLLPQALGTAQILRMMNRWLDLFSLILTLWFLMKLA